MSEFEWPEPAFQGGNSNRLKPSYIAQLLVDAFDSSLYNRLQTKSRVPHINETYLDNNTFWMDALHKQHFQSMSVRLQNFYLTEWIPSAPGRYFTSEAQLSREKAKYLYSPNRSEFELDGKRLMILGGVGSFRLRARELNGKGYYFLGASSTGISHEGIPIALDETTYNQLIQMIKVSGGCKVTLVGTLQLLPIDLSPIQYTRDIPKYCLVLNYIEDAQPSLSQALFTTVAITFQNFESEHVEYSQSWSFYTLQLGPSDNGLDRAVNWLKDYIKRHSRMKNPRILFDFDEHYQHFDNPVEFSLSDISDNHFNASRLEYYSKRLGWFTTINIKEIHHMDTYNVSGQAGAVGPNAHVHDMTFNQISNQSGETIDLPQLAEQLSILRTKMREQAAEPEHDEAVGAIASAERAARIGESSKVLEALARAGKWALDIATQIGTGLAVEAIKAAMGIH